MNERIEFSMSTLISNYLIEEHNLYALWFNTFKYSETLIKTYVWVNNQPYSNQPEVNSGLENDFSIHSLTNRRREFLE